MSSYFYILKSKFPNTLLFCNVYLQRYLLSPLPYPERDPSTVIMVICWSCINQDWIISMQETSQENVLITLSWANYLFLYQSISYKVTTGDHHDNCIRSSFSIMSGTKQKFHEYPLWKAKKDKIIAYQLETVSAVSMENEANPESRAKTNDIKGILIPL